MRQLSFNLKLVPLAIFPFLFSLAPAVAQMPGGPPIPNDSLQAGDIHGVVRLGYYVASGFYRFQGQYGLTANVARIGSSPVYVFGNVDIESLSGKANSFQPDRQTGTFEVGVRRIAGRAPLSVFIRHQSPHNIDRNDRRQGSWEMVGARWTQRVKGTKVTLSTGPYIHRIVARYQWDADLQTATPLGRVAGRALELDGDLHQVFNGSPQKNFTELWIETNILLTPHIQAYIGTGRLQDIDVYNGRSDTPVVAGVKFIF